VPLRLRRIILNKALVLREDSKIKDSTITQQIQQT